MKPPEQELEVCTHVIKEVLVATTKLFKNSSQTFRLIRFLFLIWFTTEKLS